MLCPSNPKVQGYAAIGRSCFCKFGNLDSKLLPDLVALVAERTLIASSGLLRATGVGLSSAVTGFPRRSPRFTTLVGAPASFEGGDDRALACGGELITGLFAAPGLFAAWDKRDATVRGGVDGGPAAARAGAAATGFEAEDEEPPFFLKMSSGFWGNTGTGGKRGGADFTTPVATGTYPVVANAAGATRGGGRGAGGDLSPKVRFGCGRRWLAIASMSLSISALVRKDNKVRNSVCSDLVLLANASRVSAPCVL